MSAPLLPLFLHLHPPPPNHVRDGEQVYWGEGLALLGTCKVASWVLWWSLHLWRTGEEASQVRYVERRLLGMEFAPFFLGLSLDFLTNHFPPRGSGPR